MNSGLAWGLWAIGAAWSTVEWYRTYRERHSFQMTGRDRDGCLVLRCRVWEYSPFRVALTVVAVALLLFAGGWILRSFVLMLLALLGVCQYWLWRTGR